MPDAELVVGIEAILTALEAQSLVCRELIDLAKLQGERQTELQDGLADLERRLSFVAGRSRLLHNMKGATLTTKCARCRAEFATEPGPPLCGPCWTELGRPDRYLSSVPSPSPTEGNTTA